MSRAGATVAASAGGAARAMPLLGAVLLVGGLALVTTAVLSNHDVSPEPPYEVRLVEREPEPALRELAALLPEARLEASELVALPTGRVVARGWHLRASDTAPVLLGWRSELAEPILHAEIDPAEELRLVQALRRHLPEGAPVYALPDRSRRLARLAGVHAPLAGADDSAGLRIPEPWLDAAAAIRATERARAGLRGDPHSDAAFGTFVDALLAPVDEGMARLQVAAGGREAFLALHVLDAFTLGLLRPEAIAVGLHDLPGGAAVHDSIRLVKSWIREQGHAAYAVLPRGPEVLRALFLARSDDTRCLLAHLLPFDTADLGALPALRLVFQTGGYWIWRIEPVVAAAEKR